jgi:hypothetical protein
MKPNERELKEGDVVQLSPNVSNPIFAGCFMIVSEPKSFGAQGYCQPIGSHGAVTYQGVAYYRAQWDEMEYIGHAVWGVK